MRLNNRISGLGWELPSIDFGAMLSSVVDGLVNKIPEIGINVATSLATAKLQDALGVQPVSTTPAKPAAAAPATTTAAPATQPTTTVVVKDTAGQPVAVTNVPGMPKEPLPSWVLPVAIGGGLLLVGGVFMAATRKK